MKKLICRWIDLPAEIYEEITNKWDYIQSEIFEYPDGITEFYAEHAEQGGVLIERMEKDVYKYINDNGDKRIIEIIDEVVIE